MNRSKVTALILTMWLCAIATVAMAADGSFGFGKTQAGLTIGYAHNIPFSRTVREADYIHITPQFGVGITDSLGGNSWYRGNFDLIGEGVYLHEFSPRSGNAFGGNILIRYNFLAGTKLIPYIETGAGLLALNFNIENQRDGLNYTGHGGVGIIYFLTEQAALTSSARYHHISNGEHHKNGGINAAVFSVGLSYFFSK